MLNNMRKGNFCKIWMRSGKILWFILKKVINVLHLTKLWKFFTGWLDGDCYKTTVQTVVISFTIIQTLEHNCSSFLTKCQWGNLREKFLKRKKFNPFIKKINNSKMTMMKTTKMIMNKIPQLNKSPMLHLLSNPNQLNNSNNNNKQSNKLRVLKLSLISLKP